MKPVLLIDFGSTYTKATAVDVEGECLLGTAQSGTTVGEDISIGLERALAELKAQTGISEFSERYACSSAAGGLRMVASGLVPSLTAEAAKRAALGAGAKVVKTFAYTLTDEDIAELDAIQPEIMLLCGGTDGGNKDCAIANCQALTQVKADFPVILACNRAATAECRQILEASGREVIPCENVMPVFNRLNIAPAQAVIREVFLRRIIKAKGLSKAQSLLSGILMPTPAAVMTALSLLSKSIGELMAVDLGGATTDVYSISKGLPTHPGTVLRGLPEPYEKRTVEGDIGMRYGAPGIVEAAGMARISEISGQDEAFIEAYLASFQSAPDHLAANDAERSVDFALATLAIETGLIRHAGTLEEVFTPMGVAYQQTGKDLTDTTKLILTGGALIRMGKAPEMAKLAMRSMAVPNSLMPRKAEPALDRDYILSAMGLLSQKYPQIASNLLIKEFC